MKNTLCFYILLACCFLGKAQSSVDAGEEVTEFMPYQIMSFLTTTLGETTTQPTTTIRNKEVLIPYRVGRFWGYCDAKKNIKIPVQYDYASTFHADVAYVKKGESYFFINKNGEELSLVNWIASSNESSYGAPIYGVQDDTYFLAQGKKQKTTNSRIRINSSATNGLLKVFNKAKRAGVVDVYGTPIVPIRYDDISFETEDMIITVLDNKYGLYSKEGKELSIPKYSFIGSFENGIARMAIARQYGYINTKGEEVIPPKYSSLYRDEGYVKASDNDGNKGILDEKGNVLIPLKYKYIRPLNSTFFVATNQEGKKGILDRKEKIIQPFIYRSISSDEGTMFIAEDKSGYRYINGTSGKLISKNRYKRADKFGDRPLARVTNEKYKRGFVDRNGKEVIPPQWYSADWFKDGYSEVRVSSDGSTTGLIDTKGTLVVDTIYSDIKVFEKANRAAVRNWKLHEGKWAFVNFKGKKLSGFEYDRVVKKNNGYAIIEKDDLKGVLDASGKQVLPIQFKRITMVKEAYFIVKNKENKYGTYDLRGNVLEPCKYHDIYKTRNGTAIVETQERKMGVINTKGKLSASGFYDEIYRPKHWNKKATSQNFVMSQGTFKGMLSKEGEVIIPPKYYKLYYVINNLTLVDVTGEGKQYGYVGLNGVEYFEK